MLGSDRTGHPMCITADSTVELAGSVLKPFPGAAGSNCTYIAVRAAGYSHCFRGCTWSLWRQA